MTSIYYNTANKMKSMLYPCIPPKITKVDHFIWVEKCLPETERIIRFKTKFYKTQKEVN